MNAAMPPALPIGRREKKTISVIDNLDLIFRSRAGRTPPAVYFQLLPEGISLRESSGSRSDGQAWIIVLRTHRT